MLHWVHATYTKAPCVTGPDVNTLVFWYAFLLNDHIYIPYGIVRLPCYYIWVLPSCYCPKTWCYTGAWLIAPFYFTNCKYFNSEFISRNSKFLTHNSVFFIEKCVKSQNCERKVAITFYIFYSMEETKLYSITMFIYVYFMQNIH